MRHPLPPLVVVCLALVEARHASAQDLGLGQQANLDLPVTSTAHAVVEEDAPGLIVFYGEVYETDATFFCLDRSLSMREGEWVELQRELDRVIVELSPSMEFGIVFFDEQVKVHPHSGRPATASPDAKRAARDMVRETSASQRSTCFLEGLRVVLEMANASEARRKNVIFMSDGKATCAGHDTATYVSETLAEARALNRSGAEIDTVGVGVDIAEAFLVTLAQDSGGTFRRLRPPDAR